MTKRRSRTVKPNTLTVRLKTSIRSMVPFDVEIDGAFVPRTAADEGETVKLPAADAERMIAKGRAKRVPGGD